MIHKSTDMYILWFKCSTAQTINWTFQHLLQYYLISIIPKLQSTEKKLWSLPSHRNSGEIVHLFIYTVVVLQAIEATYIDKKCPFTGNVSIRGRILTGIVASMKMKRTIIIRRDYLHYIKKYNRFEKRHKNLSCHLSPCFR